METEDCETRQKQERRNYWKNYTKSKSTPEIRCPKPAVQHFKTNHQLKEQNLEEKKEKQKTKNDNSGTYKIPESIRYSNM